VAGGMGLPGLGGGGGGTNAITAKGTSKTLGSALRDLLSGDDGRSRYMTDQEKSQRMVGGGLVRGFKGGGLVEKFKSQYPTLTDDQIQAVIDRQKENMKILERTKSGKEKTYHPLITPPKVTPLTLEQKVANALQVDYGSSSTGIDVSDAFKNTAINISNTEEKSSAIEITPAMIKSTEDAVAKYEVKPKEKKNVVIAYEQESGKGKQQKDAPPPGGNDIPAFDVRPPFMTDQDKLMVLGMRV